MLYSTVNMGEIVLIKVYNSVSNHTVSHPRLRLYLQSMNIFKYKWPVYDIYTALI
jgi:hypothetical protein